MIHHSHSDLQFLTDFLDGGTFCLLTRKPPTVWHPYALLYLCIFTRWRIYVSSRRVLLARTAMIFGNPGFRRKDVAASLFPSDFSIGDRVHLHMWEN